MVERFAESERAAALAAAAEVHTEVEFLARWPGDAERERFVNLAGFLDCLYRDQGGWELGRYKTNDVPADEVQEAARHYEMQLYFYAFAATQALGEPPASLALHFLAPSREVTIAWNAEQRRQLDDWLTDRLRETGRRSAAFAARGLGASADGV